MLSWGFMLPLPCFVNCEVGLYYSFILVREKPEQEKEENSKGGNVYIYCSYVEHWQNSILHSNDKYSARYVSVIE